MVSRPSSRRIASAHGRVTKAQWSSSSGRWPGQVARTMPSPATSNAGSTHARVLSARRRVARLRSSWPPSPCRSQASACGVSGTGSRRLGISAVWASIDIYIHHACEGRTEARLSVRPRSTRRGTRPGPVQDTAARPSAGGLSKWVEMASHIAAALIGHVAQMTETASKRPGSSHACLRRRGRAGRAEAATDPRGRTGACQAGGRADNAPPPTFRHSPMGDARPGGQCARTAGRTTIRRGPGKH